MSLLYTLFGIPRTIDEFADMAKRKGLRAKVWVGAYAQDPVLGTDISHCVYLVAGGTTFEYFRARHSRSQDPTDVHLSKATRSQALAKAGEAHAILSRAGLESKLHNHYEICELVT